MIDDFGQVHQGFVNEFDWNHDQLLEFLIEI